MVLLEAVKLGEPLLDPPSLEWKDKAYEVIRLLLQFYFKLGESILVEQQLHYMCVHKII